MDDLDLLLLSLGGCRRQWLPFGEATAVQELQLSVRISKFFKIAVH